MFHIPENILEIYDPWKNYHLFTDMEQRRLPQYEKPITHYFIWEPLPPITIEEAEQFLQEELGMVKTEIDDIERTLIKNRQKYHKNMKYETTYIYPNLDVRHKWAAQEEIEEYNASQKTHENAIKMFQQKATATGDSNLRMKEFAAQSERDKCQDTNLTLHIYSDADGNFADIDGRGAVLMPKVALLSLHHLMGKAPTPEEMQYLWQRYLQFLIDIGYVNDFVKELNIAEKNKLANDTLP